MNKLKIFFPVDTSWGLVMHRITYDIQRFAPHDKFEFVDTYEKCDIAFWHLIGPNKVQKEKPYVILFHCFGRDRGEIAMREIWLENFKQAEMVYGYYPLHKFIGEDDMKEINYVRQPWGVDNTIFYRMPEVKKQFTCVATGYVAQTEALLELYRACKAVGGKLLHIGGSLDREVGLLNPMYYERICNVSDDDMRRAYNSAYWVSGLRRVEGYEIPALEGFVCGAQPICFNIEDFYPYWFGDFANFIPQGSVDDTTEALAKLFSVQPLINSKKIEEIKNKFDTEKLSRGFWDVLIQSLTNKKII